MRGLDCLARFAQRLHGYAPSQIRAVATQTLREARNRDAFLARAQTVLGQPIEVISGREEARLIYAGVARLQPSQRPRLVVDIGGRSTEMILGRGRQPLLAESFRVGSVSLSMKYFGDGKLAELTTASGTARYLQDPGVTGNHMLAELDAGGNIQRAYIHGLGMVSVLDGPSTYYFMAAGRVDRLSLPGLKDDRRAVIAGGLSILYTLAAHFGIATLLPARGALRQGVIFDLDERLQAARHEESGHDIRDASVRELQRRFMVDAQQAQRVREVAESLYDGVQPRSSAEASHEARRELQWACALHEVGMMVSHHDHHRHSAYVLAHVDAPGFSQSQQRRLGDLVLAQRGGLRKVETSLASETFAWQAMCLRLAIIRCHARGDVDAGSVSLQRRGNHATLTVPSDWAQSQPRTLHLLNEEVAAWERGGPLILELVQRAK